MATRLVLCGAAGTEGSCAAAAACSVAVNLTLRAQASCDPSRLHVITEALVQRDRTRVNGMPWNIDGAHGSPITAQAQQPDKRILTLVCASGRHAPCCHLACVLQGCCVQESGMIRMIMLLSAEDVCTAHKLSDARNQLQPRISPVLQPPARARQHVSSAAQPLSGVCLLRQTGAQFRVTAMDQSVTTSDASNGDSQCWGS